MKYVFKSTLTLSIWSSISRCQIVDNFDLVFIRSHKWRQKCEMNWVSRFDTMFNEYFSSFYTQSMKACIIAFTFKKFNVMNCFFLLNLFITIMTYLHFFSYLLQKRKATMKFIKIFWKYRSSINKSLSNSCLFSLNVLILLHMWQTFKYCAIVSIIYDQ